MSTCLGVNAGQMTTTAGGQKPECHGKAKLTKGYCEEWRSAEAERSAGEADTEVVTVFSLLFCIVDKLISCLGAIAGHSAPRAQPSTREPEFQRA